MDLDLFGEKIRPEDARLKGHTSEKEAKSRAGVYEGIGQKEFGPKISMVAPSFVIVERLRPRNGPYLTTLLH